MHRPAVFVLATAAIAAALAVPPAEPLIAQNRLSFPLVSRDGGHVALGLALRRLNVSGTFMQAPAHPDDETNALLAMFAHGLGLRTVDVQNNRGDGGQNEIGPELFRDMAVLRTSELLSAHRIDGAEQYFTRAIDYGYSFDPEEVIGKWGRKEIVGDYVRLIRTLRPDVLLTMNIQGRGGDRAHEATTILAREAYFAAGKPDMYPEQIQEGLRPWQPRKLYFSGGGGGGGRGAGGRGGDPAGSPAGTARVNTQIYDELLGRTYAEIGFDARTYHKCQGTSQMPGLPGATGGRGGGGPATYQLIDSRIPRAMGTDETSLFSGIDTSLESIVHFADPNPPQALTSGLAEIAGLATRAQKAFDAGNDAGTAEPVAAGLGMLRRLRSSLGSIGLSDDARYEVDFRLQIKERDYARALLVAAGLAVDAVADDGLVIGGQPVKLSLVATNRGAASVSVDAVTLEGFESASPCAPGPVPVNAVYTCSADAHVPASARLTTPYFSDDYWKHPSNQAINRYEPDVPFGVPFRPTPFRATFHLKANGVDVTAEAPIQFRYVKDIYLGDKRMELNVVPAFSVVSTPPLAIIPAAAATGAGKPLSRDIQISVTNGTKGAAQASVRLRAPVGWTVTPPSVPLAFTVEDESLSARFEITPPAGVQPGSHTLRAEVTSPAAAGQTFSEGYDEIDYPHIERRQVIKPAETTVKVVDVHTTPNLTVGYVVGVGDQVPPALEQLGARVRFIDQDELSSGDLSKYDVIITGVRAYERRADLRASNRRLLEYAERGGTVIVQYNKMEFNRAQYGPYPASVSSNRITDETAPVKMLVREHPVFNRPNKIGQSTWDGWVQERGLYFLGEKDPKYVDLVAMTDPFPDNPGEKLGALVEANVGKGRWIYLGLGLWRQLPAGTEGAYQLLANLISLPKAPRVGQQHSP
jgi:GlcNAc-PI de-N-acetylase/NPCBM-associated, NEW3 domain of alpha-galactosidase